MRPSKGIDAFYFTSGHDTITDFTTRGSSRDQIELDNALVGGINDVHVAFQ